MIGDGVNDVPALAMAHLSNTVKGGTVIAGETSDVLLTKPDLFLASWFLETSRRIKSIIRQNPAWAFISIVITIPLANPGLISPILPRLPLLGVFYWW
jgi:P-type E1-E2 ATPase